MAVWTTKDREEYQSDEFIDAEAITEGIPIKIVRYSAKDAE